MNHKILLIDDDKTMISLLSKILELEGFSVIPFDGKEDLDVIVNLIHNEHPAICLIDIHLKEISGFDILHRLQNEKNLPDCRVIMSSGIDFNAQCLVKGAHGFIQKPYMPEELVELINQMLPNSTLAK